MLSFSSTMRIFLCVVPIDMRKSFDTLAELVRYQMGEEPLSGDLYLFRNRDESKLKMLFWDRDGFVIFYKRLEKGRFALPEATGQALEIDATSLAMLLYGLDKKDVKKQARYKAGLSS